MTSPSPTRRGLAGHRSIGNPAINAVVEIEWKNRYQISAKLNEHLYADLIRWCRGRDMSINEAIKEILENHLGEPKP